MLSVMSPEKAFQRVCTYINDPSLMPDLNWNVSPNTSNIQFKNKGSSIPISKHNYNP